MAAAAARRARVGAAFPMPGPDLHHRQAAHYLGHPHIPTDATSRLAARLGSSRPRLARRLRLEPPAGQTAGAGGVAAPVRSDGPGVDCLAGRERRRITIDKIAAPDRLHHSRSPISSRAARSTRMPATATRSSVATFQLAPGVGVLAAGHGGPRPARRRHPDREEQHDAHAVRPTPRACSAASRSPDGHRLDHLVERSRPAHRRRPLDFAHAQAQWAYPQTARPSPVDRRRDDTLWCLLHDRIWAAVPRCPPVASWPRSARRSGRR